MFFKKSQARPPALVLLVILPMKALSPLSYNDSPAALCTLIRPHSTSTNTHS